MFRRTMLAVVAFVAFAAAMLLSQEYLITVNGESMEPTYFTGDLVITAPLTPEVGDVIVYDSELAENGRVIHRITEETENGWITQGDNNDKEDPEVPADAVTGVAVAHIPNIGGVFHSPYFVGPAMGLAVLIVFWPTESKDEENEEQEETVNA